MKTPRSNTSNALGSAGLRLLFVGMLALLPLTVLMCDPSERLRSINVTRVF